MSGPGNKALEADREARDTVEMSTEELQELIRLSSAPPPALEEERDTVPPPPEDAV